MIPFYEREGRAEYADGQDVRAASVARRLGAFGENLPYGRAHVYHVYCNRVVLFLIESMHPRIAFEKKLFI